MTSAEINNPEKIRFCKIGDRAVGPGQPVFVIAEIAQAHDGSLGMAHSYIDAAASAGADAVKFQTHIAEAESTPSEPWRVKFSFQDETRFDYWKRMEFTEPQWVELKKHADDAGLVFLSSPFSSEAVTLLESVGVAAWKIASGETVNRMMMERMAESGLPFLLSTGMSTLAEIDEAVRWIQGKGLQLALFQCASFYPTPPERVGLNLLPFFQERYRCPVGLSDHSGKIYAGLAAAAIGCDLLEVHLTMSREMFGPDVPASVSTVELAQMVEGLRYIEAMKGNPVNKDETAEDLEDMRRLFTKSIVLRRDLKAGSVLKREDLAVKKPGTGIPSHRLENLPGRCLRRDIAANEIFQETDLD